MTDARGPMNLHISMTPFSNESRVLKETRSLVEHDLVDRVCIVALHEGTLETHQPIDESRDVVRLKLRTRSWPKSLIVQLFKYLEFSFRTAQLARSLNAKIINVHSVALLPLGVALKLITGGKLVYDAHELETETAGLGGLRKRLTKLVEKTCIGPVDLIVVVSDGIEAWYRDHYRLDNIVTVRNTPSLVEIERTELLRTNLAIPEATRILLYQGGLSKGRGIELLLAAAPALANEGYAVVFMGYGELKPLVEAAAERSDNIYYHPAVAPDLVLGYTASADIGLCSIEDVSLSYRLSLPNKLFEYLMAGLPAVVSRLPEMDRFVTENRVGVSVPAWDAGHLVAALKELEALRTDGFDARLAEVVRQNCWQTEEKKLVKAYRKHVLHETDLRASLP